MNVKNNILAGITSAIVALPLALAFGIASGMGVVAGLYGAIILGFFAAIFGGTKTQISGPTGPMTVVMAGVVALFPNDPNTIATIVLLAGVFQILFGFVQIGKFVNFIPYPVISGFMSGIGIIIIVLQVNPAIGSSFSGSVLQILAHLPSSFAHLQLQSLVLAAITLCILFFTPKKIALVIPTPLIALIAVTTLSIILDWNVPIIGAIPSQMLTFVLPHITIEHLNNIIPYALTLAVLGSIDSLLTSVVADSLSKTKHNSNKELIGQGIGNALCGIFGAIPGAGATMRTVINIKSGATHRLSGVTHSVALALFVLGGSFLVENIPLAVLAGILIKVGIDILDYRLIKHITKAPRHDVFVMFVVLFLTVFVDLIIAVGVGMVLASLLLVKRMSDKLTIQTEVVSNRSIDTELHEEIMVIHIDGAFFFGTTNQIISRTNGKLPIKTLLFDCSKVPFMDLSALFAIEEAIKDLHNSQIRVIIVLKSQTLKAKFDKIGLTHIVGEENIFLDYERAIKVATSTI